ncbi:hypothetical protein A5634_25235 [Mycobacterium asiaticum]|uniref:Lipoprotein n=1 Tax=Mycobacterium asiaticum TaxID=1790 RepID=A0A1A3NVG9_MYCAS|nr:hypothetical protein [Mycobacterium asiaticum]OBK25951.1 hypothetical protein A5634_25235 [Mycobacterium asiaticum]
MRVPGRLFVSGCKSALVAVSACLAAASCATSATVNPPAAQSTQSTVKPPPNTVAPPPAHISPLAKDWKAYGDTVYFGCPTEFSVSKSALEDIRPKILDPNTADLIMPGVPMVAADQIVTGAACALSNNIGDMKVVYVVTTVTPGRESEAPKTTAYVFDLRSSQPLATRELQPPTPESKLGAAKDWRLAPTTTGVAWINAFTDARGAASPPKTVILANTDLSTLWDDPQPARVWQDVLSFQRTTTAGSTVGAELRLPTGEPVYQDNDIATVDAELSDGADKLVQITRRDPQNPAVVFTTFFDLSSRALVKIGDTERISGGGLVATLSDGKLFVDGRGSDTSQFGYGVWNLRTQHWDLLVSRDDARKQSISKLAYFGDHVYVTNSANTFSVLKLPETNPVATNWSERPFGRIVGWTLVCRGETEPQQKGECREILLVRDTDGRYPGPWF